MKGVESLITEIVNKYNLTTEQAKELKEKYIKDNRNEVTIETELETIAVSTLFFS